MVALERGATRGPSSGELADLTVPSGANTRSLEQESQRSNAPSNGSSLAARIAANVQSGMSLEEARRAAGLNLPPRGSPEWERMHLRTSNGDYPLLGIRAGQPQQGSGSAAPDVASSFRERPSQPQERTQLTGRSDAFSGTVTTSYVRPSSTRATEQSADASRVHQEELRQARQGIVDGLQTPEALTDKVDKRADQLVTAVLQGRAHEIGLRDGRAIEMIKELHEQDPAKAKLFAKYLINPNTDKVWGGSNISHTDERTAWLARRYGIEGDVTQDSKLMHDLRRKIEQDSGLREARRRDFLRVIDRAYSQTVPAEQRNRVSLALNINLNEPPDYLQFASHNNLGGVAIALGKVGDQQGREQVLAGIAGIGEKYKEESERLRQERSDQRLASAAAIAVRDPNRSRNPMIQRALAGTPAAPGSAVARYQEALSRAIEERDAGKPRLSVSRGPQSVTDLRDMYTDMKTRAEKGILPNSGVVPDFLREYYHDQDSHDQARVREAFSLGEKPPLGELPKLGFALLAEKYKELNNIEGLNALREKGAAMGLTPSQVERICDVSSDFVPGDGPIARADQRVDEQIAHDQERSYRSFLSSIVESYQQAYVANPDTAASTVEALLNREHLDYLQSAGSQLEAVINSDPAMALAGLDNSREEIYNSFSQFFSSYLADRQAARNQMVQLYRRASGETGVQVEKPETIDLQRANLIEVEANTSGLVAERDKPGFADYLRKLREYLKNRAENMVASN